MISKTFLNKSKKYFVFIILMIIGSIIYKDYGFNIDEKFHRSNGFYWLNYIAQYFNLDNLSLISQEKLNSITGFTLSDINFYNKYGVAFDVPAALLEIILKIDTPLGVYQLRHYLVFLYFILGLFFLYKLILRRFRNENLAIIAVILLFLTPRLFGDSFQNTKDIIFLTFIIISTYYCFISIDLPSNKNILMFSFFSAVATSIRMFGICLPLTFIFLQLSLINKNNLSYILLKSLITIISFFIFLIITWPLLWENTISSFLSYFEILDEYFNSKVFFLGNFYEADLLPYTYLPIWILISTPVLHLALFVIGFSYVSKRVFNRLTTLSNNSIYPDFWRSKDEAKDFFIFINFIILFLGLIFIDIKFYNSWRIAYFLYFFMIYFSVLSFYLISLKKSKLYLKNLFKIFTVSFFLITSYRIFLYHPYQSYYFNIFVPDKIKKNVEVDYTGLSAIHFLNEIVEENYKGEVIKIGVASWYPLWRMVELINVNTKDKIKIVGIKENKFSDYIYTNKISDVDTNFNRKYDIPSNFIKFKELNIDGATIYEVYKRK